MLTWKRKRKKNKGYFDELLIQFETEIWMNGNWLIDWYNY